MSAKRWLNALVGITLVVVAIAFYTTIYVDGLGVVLAVVFPYSAVVLSLLVLTFIIGIRKRKEASMWFINCLIVLGLGLLLWTPLVTIVRDQLDLVWRQGARQSVVDDIISGDLLYENGYAVVPFEKYGRVSFSTKFDDHRKFENTVNVDSNLFNGFQVTFVTNGGFFGPKDMLMYVDHVDPNVHAHRYDQQIDEHWIKYRKQTSFLKF